VNKIREKSPFYLSFFRVPLNLIFAQETKVKELQEIMLIFQYLNNYLLVEIKIEYQVFSIVYFRKYNIKLCYHLKNDKNGYLKLRIC